MPSRETVIDTAPVTRHLLGRRRHARLSVQHEVECTSASRSWPGRVLDLSRVGALVCLAQPEFRAKTDQDLFSIAGRLAFMFADGLKMHFVRSDLWARARIVRVARQSARGPTVIGCEFGRPLTFRECRLLGIKAGDDEAVPGQ
jgi:hypothetical protein